MYKYRCQLAIRDQAVWLSHLDILAMVEKTIRRSALPVAFSQGFNPHMQISWGPAHPVGLSSEHEYVDIIFTRPLSDEDINHLAASMPSGLALNSAHAVDMSASSLMADVDFATYAVCLSDYNEEKLDQAIADFINADQVMLERYSPKKGRKLVDVRPAVERLHREGSMLYVGMHLNAGAAAKMPELVTLLDPQAVIVSARRTGMFVTRKGERCLP